MKTMKTLTCETPGKFVMSDQPVPVPKEGEALVRITRVGICGTDLHAFAGNQPFFNYPRVLGHELAAVVEQLPTGVTHLAVGDAVCIVPVIGCGTCIACRNNKPNCCVNINLRGVHSDGGMCEYMALPVENLIKSESLNPDQLAMVECCAIGAHAVRRAQINPGEKVLVVGAGPIGLGLMQFARVAGGDVIVMDMSDKRLAVAKNELGFTNTIQAGVDDPKEKLAEFTNGDMPTVIFDCTGNPKAMMDGFLLLGHTGRYVLVSLVTADITFPDPEFHKRETTLLSSRNANKEDFEWVMECMAQGKVNTDPMVTHRCQFGETIDTFESWTKPETGVVKAVIEI